MVYLISDGENGSIVKAVVLGSTSKRFSKFAVESKGWKVPYRCERKVSYSMKFTTKELSVQRTLTRLFHHQE